jgi:hypothetical protein
VGGTSTGSIESGGRKRTRWPSKWPGRNMARTQRFCDEKDNP